MILELCADAIASVGGGDDGKLTDLSDYKYWDTWKKLFSEGDTTSDVQLA